MNILCLSSQVDFVWDVTPELAIFVSYYNLLVVVL
jgi:hypothetical protein